MSAPKWVPQQPFVTIVTVKGKGLSLAKQRLIDVRNGILQLAAPDGSVDLAGPIPQVSVRIKSMQVELAVGSESRKLNTIAHGARIQPDVLAAYERYAGTGYVPLSAQAPGGIVDAMSGGGFGASKEMAQGNRLLVAALLALGAQGSG